MRIADTEALREALNARNRLPKDINPKKETQTMKDLILHCGATRATREQLGEIETPPPTDTWRPVPHARIADLVVGNAQANGYRIESEQYGLNPSGTKMFGVLRFHPEDNPEYTRAMGFRNSHDMSFALGLTVGLRVIVCDNLCFGGEQTLHRRHTSGIDPEELIVRAFATFHVQFDLLAQNCERLKSREIDMDDARLIAVHAAEAGAIPSCDILAVLGKYREPEHEPFQAPTMWSLCNAFTENAKKYSPERADTCYRKLSGVFGLS